MSYSQQLADALARIEALEEMLRKALIDPFLPRSLKTEIRTLLSTTEPDHG